MPCGHGDQTWQNDAHTTREFQETERSIKKVTRVDKKIKDYNCTYTIIHNII